MQQVYIFLYGKRNHMVDPLLRHPLARAIDYRFITNLFSLDYQLCLISAI